MKISNTLTTYVRGYAPTVDDEIARFLAPEVETGAAAGNYLEFNERQDFQAPNTKRAIGGKVRRITWDAAKLKKFDCQPNGLEITIDDHERDQAGDEDMLLERAKIRTLVNNSVNATSAEVIALGRTISAFSGAGSAWSGSDDPIDQIDSAIYEIAVATGTMPNRILFGLGAWRRFRNNAKVRGRIPSTKAGVVREVDAQGMFLNPSIETKVSMLTIDSANIGLDSASKADLVADDVFIFHGANAPSQYDPSFMKRLRVRRGGVTTVEFYREDNSKSDVYQTNWTNQTLITSAISARRIRVSG
jgi:hypothetical protein